VIRGAGGSLYGSSAIGGVINQISEEGTGAPKFSLLSDGGNWDTERQVATASGALDRLGYSGSVSYYSTGGFQPVNSENDNLSLTSRLDYHLTDDTALRAFARYTFADVGLPESNNFLPGNPLDSSTHQRTEFMLYKGEVDSHITDKLLIAEKLEAERQLERHRDFLIARSKIATLPMKYQDVITLRYFEQLSVGEIAEILRKKEGTVRSLVSRGLQRLRKLM